MTKHVQADTHRMVPGDEKVRKKKEKSFKIKFICVEDRSDEIVLMLMKREFEKVLEKYGAISDNLDEVVQEHITSSRGNVK